LGLPGRVPARVDAATKAGLLDLLERAVAAGFQFRAACRVLEPGTVRAYRWLGRRAADELEDGRPGGSPLHGLLDWEVAEIVALFHQWGEVDRSHRKLAHRGSYLERVWVSPSSVRRVLAAEGLRLRPLPRPGRSVRKPFPDWVEYTPNSTGIFDTTHFTRAGVAATVTWDLVSRKVAPPSSSRPRRPPPRSRSCSPTRWTAKGSCRSSRPATTPGRPAPRRPVPADPAGPQRQRPQMTSGSTREFMALCAIHQHFGRPGTPTDQAWTWVAVRPRQGRVAPPGQDPRPGGAARRARGGPRALQRGTAARRDRLRHPNDEHEGRDPAIRKAREVGLEQARLRRIAYHRVNRTPDPSTHPEHDPPEEPGDVG
jgi:putative transposase